MRRRYTCHPVKTTLETLDDNKIKLSIELDDAEFDRSIDLAFKKIAQEVRLPGFRAGKAPRKLLEARIGISAARQQALQDSVPVYLAKAVREHDLDIIATPDVTLVSGEEEGPVAFDATCEVRPVVSVPGYQGLRVELPAVEASAEEIEEVVSAERRRHGNLVDVDRATQAGDYVTLDLQGTREGEPVPGLNTDDWVYEIGRGWVAPSFDEEVTGAVKGATLTFSAVPNGTQESADFSVTVQRIQVLELAELTDEWVAEHVAEHDTVEAWRAAIVERINTMKLNQARNVLIDRVSDALAELVDVDAPESMVNNDLQARVQNTVQQFQSQGIALDQWLSATGQDTNQFVDSLKEQSVKAAKVDLALRAVASSEGLVADTDDLELEYQRIAMRVGQKVNTVRKAYEKNDAVPDLAAQISKSKALDWLLHNVTMVDPEGKELDRETVLGHTHDHDEDHNHEHDHDHDHAGEGE
jgi:trigger factor